MYAFVGTVGGRAVAPGGCSQSSRFLGRRPSSMSSAKRAALVGSPERIRGGPVMAVTAISPPQEILDSLLRANEAYAAGNSTGDNIAKDAAVASRQALETGQAPLACVVCCADSRVPPEVIFQKGLGQLFIVRTAGNRADDNSVLGSVQYAICHLNVKLLIVLGHSSCGAIGAAIDASKGTYPDKTEAALVGYLETLAPFIKDTLSSTETDDPNALCCDANIRNVVDSLRSDPAIASRKPLVVGGKYKLNTGLVEMIA